jgi:ABC-type sugar transport system ATPase subunit
MLDESNNNDVALCATGLSKTYGETRALDGVDLTLRFSTITGVVGENGAGKSTLLNMLSGITKPDRGSLEIAGKAVALSGYDEAQKLGIARVFQEQALIANLPVFENILLGCEQRFTRLGQLLTRRRMIELAQKMIEEAGAHIDVLRVTKDLTFSERQLVEIIRACAGPTALYGVTAPIVLLDEPTASLEKADEEIFFRLLEKIRGAGGAILFVSHRLGEVLGVSDEILVLKDGRNVAVVHPHSSSERELHRLMVGRERDTDYYHEREQLDDSNSRIVFAAKGLSKPGSYHKISLEVRAGEVLGIGGLLDSGKSPLGKGLAGIDRPIEGEVQLGDDPWARPDVRRLKALGLGYVPAERMLEGLIPDYSVAWNVSMASGDDIFSSRWGLWRHRLEYDVSQTLIDRLRIKARSPHISCRRLSGGNQQKVVLARWLARDLTVLVLDNPTRGVDAGAKEEIYGLIRELSRKGVAVVLITDELLELIGMSNRIAIMRHGKIKEIISSPASQKPTEQQLVELMLFPDGDHIQELAA